jgi:copper(I)-binding protein
VTARVAWPGAGWLRDLARAAAGPVVCAAVVIGLLSAWVATGGAGTITTVSRVRIEVTLAAIPMHSLNPGPADAPQPPAGAYLTIRNLSGTPDALTAVSSRVARRVILTRHGAGRAGRAGSVLPGLPIPAHGTLTLSPSGDDAVLIGGPRLLAGQQVPLTLTFRYAGQIEVEATVTIPGSP